MLPDEVVQIAPSVFVTGAAIIGGIHVASALGAPIGPLAWPPLQPHVLSTRLRVASVGVVVLLAAMSTVVFAKAFDATWISALPLQVAAWVVVAIAVAGAAAVQVWMKHPEQHAVNFGLLVGMAVSASAVALGGGAVWAIDPARGLLQNLPGWIPERWFPEGLDIGSAIAAALAAMAALLTIVVTLSQWGISARARRLVTWSASAIPLEDDEERRRALRMLAIRSQAVLVSRELVPTRLYLGGLYGVIVPVLYLVVPAFASWPIPLLMAAAVGNVALIALALRGAVRVHCERVRIRRQYEHGALRVEDPMLHLQAMMEGGTRRELTLGLLASLALTIGGAGFAWTILDVTQGVGPALALAGLLGFVGCLFAISQHAEKLAKSEIERQVASAP